MTLDNDVERRNESRLYYLGVLVALVHAFVALALCDDLPCVLDDYLVWFECAVGSYAVATINSLRDLDANIVFPSRFTSLL